MKDDGAVAGFRLHLVSDQENDSGPVGQAADPTQVEIQDYITDMLVELRDLARTSGLRSLAAILEVAAHSARIDAGKVPDAGQRR
jgi:hypothetical protein